MIRVMIVDDEPFIRQGLKILINWENYGFDVVAEASNGMEALEQMKKCKIDLVFTDIKMPKMDGISLIGYIREYISKEVRFVILSGFYEYEYAKKAIRYDVEDYLLKPIQKEELIHLLEEYKERHYKKLEEWQRMEVSERIMFDNYIFRLINGIKTSKEIGYIRQRLYDSENLRYIGIEFDQTNETYLKQPEDEKIRMQLHLYDSIRNFLGKLDYHVFLEPVSSSTESLIGFIYVTKMTEGCSMRERDYIRRLHHIIKESNAERTILFIGQKVQDISMISDSYASAKIARNFHYFSEQNEITFYDEIKLTENREKKQLFTEEMDGLVKAIEENNEDNILKRTDAVYNRFKEQVANSDIIRVNLDYLMVNLINVIKKIDPDYDHDEIFRMINLGGKEQEAVRGSVVHIRAFSKEFAEYIFQLRQNTFGGVLKEIEREITEHYFENLNLKSLSDKYYMNSAYLGQIFKKKFGVPFKDYLNNYRIERAAEEIIRTDKKIYLIAEEVGFNNTDYFVSKFVQIKGITPLQYRKQSIE